MNWLNLLSSRRKDLLPQKALFEKKPQSNRSFEKFIDIFIVVGFLAVLFYVIFLRYGTGGQMPLPWSPSGDGSRPDPTDAPKPPLPQPHPTEGPSSPKPNPPQPPTDPPKPQEEVRKIKDQRLSNDVVPEKYSLKIQVNLPGYQTNIAPEKEYTFQGNLEINLDVKKPTNKVELNYYHTTNFTKVEMMIQNPKNGKAVIEIIETKFDPYNDKVTFIFKDNLKIGLYYLTIDYESYLENSLEGLYKTRYTSSEGHEKISAVTQMEPLAARKMVPCFDSPEFKAKWQIIVVHPNGTKAISNGMEERTLPRSDNFMETSFEETPKMSSYLLAIFVSDFLSIEGTTKSNVTFRVWTRPEAVKMAPYALEAGIKCLEYYEEYFGIPFPLKKQDMVALPDFAAGAMENWGLITYRETALLHNPKTYSPATRQYVIIVIAHELAHQWFGNLVTMEFWNDLWLNEGFASLMEYDGTDVVNKGFGMKDEILSTAQAIAFSEDSFSNSHALTTELINVPQISDLFDRITYKKGASVMNMVRSVVGDDVFRSGLQAYLTKHAYSNTVAADLLDALTNAVPNGVNGPDGKKLNLTSYAGSWIYQKGFPVVTLKYLNNTHAELSQKHYSVDQVDDNLKWDVSVRIQQGDSQNFQTLWLPKDSKAIFRVEKKPVILNADANGFFLINYSTEEWEKIFETMIKSDIYSPRTTLVIIRSAFAMSAVQKLPMKSLFKMFKYMDKTRNPLAWRTFLIEFADNILNKLRNTDEGKLAVEYLANILKPSFDSISTDFIKENYLSDDLYQEVSHQLRIYKNYCPLKRDECEKNLEGAEVLKQCGANAQSSECVNIAAPFRRDVYCKIARTGTKEEVEQLLQFYKNEHDQEEEGNLRGSFPCIKYEDILIRMLDMVNDPNDNTFRDQDAGYVYSAVASSKAGREFILDYLEKNLNKIRRLDVWIGKRIVYACSDHINTEEDLKKLERIAGGSGSLRAHFENAILAAKYRMKWLAEHRKQLAKLLKTN